MLDYGLEKPFLIQVDHDRIEGVLLPTKRRYGPSDWSGALPEDGTWTDELSLEVRFDNGFSRELFEPSW